MCAAAIETTQRKIIDVIVRSCTVALFHSHNVAVAPMIALDAVTHSERDRMLANIRFMGKGFSGALELSLPEAVLERIAERKLGPYAARDLVKEVTNQLMGRIKNRLVQFQVQLQIGVPTGLLTQPAARPVDSGKTRLPYWFKTRNGVLAVTLEGVFEEGALVFSPEHLVVQEGDVLMF